MTSADDVDPFHLGIPFQFRLSDRGLGVNTHDKITFTFSVTPFKIEIKISSPNAVRRKSITVEDVAMGTEMLSVLYRALFICPADLEVRLSRQDRPDYYFIDTKHELDSDASAENSNTLPRIFRFFVRISKRTATGGNTLIRFNARDLFTEDNYATAMHMKSALKCLTELSAIAYDQLRIESHNGTA